MNASYAGVETEVVQKDQRSLQIQAGRRDAHDKNDKYVRKPLSKTQILRLKGFTSIIR